MKVEIRPHCNDVLQIMTPAHPVTGRLARLGYCRRTSRKWSLIQGHGLSVSHIAELDQIMEGILSGDEDSGADSSD